MAKTRRKTKIDFSEVENVRLTCLKRCGKCCFFQAPVLTTAEINRILDFLETKSPEDFDSFVFDWLTYLGQLPELDEEMVEVYKESMKYFWSPFQLEEAKEGILVRNYTIHFMPSSGRCKLLNPIDMTCFVYPARSDTCQLYPFTSDRSTMGTIKIKLAMKNCPGISKGPFNLNKKEIEQLTKEGMTKARKDMMAYEKYIKDKNIKRLEVKPEKQKRNYKDVRQAILNFEKHWRDAYFFGERNNRLTLMLQKGKRFIEPLADLGIIPHHPFLVLVNDALAKQKQMPN